MSTVEEAINIASSPDAVWAVGGDIGGADSWIPAVATCSYDGELRRSTLVDGGEVVERILSRDADARTYEYEFVEGPIPFSHYRSRFTVIAHGVGSRVEWRADLGADDPDVERELVSGIADSYRASLESLRQRIEMR
jgi:Polyketide cyclase / dehydrase and lipid transport